VVNIITWDKAYALFPLPTFIHRKTYVLKPLNDYFGALLLKYSQQGWNGLGTLWPEEVTYFHPFQAERSIGDKLTWTIAFDTQGVRCPSIPDSVIEYSFFSIAESLNPDPSTRLTTHYDISAQEFSACTLRHPYTYPGATRPNFWLDLWAKESTT